MQAAKCFPSWLDAASEAEFFGLNKRWHSGGLLRGFATAPRAAEDAEEEEKEKEKEDSESDDEDLDEDGPIEDVPVIEEDEWDEDDFDDDFDDDFEEEVEEDESSENGEAGTESKEDADFE